MFAEIITIGDEILIGQIVDTNSAFIASELNKIGISVYQISSIQDDQTHILQALKEAESRVDFILITGGLGPTKDDITKHTLCTYFKDTLVENKQVLQNIEELFKKYITTSPISDINRKQALLPSRSEALHNAFGTAPGIWTKWNNKIFVSMPGVPYEMKSLMTREVLPRIIREYKRPYILHKTLITYGLGESAIADRLEDFEDALPEYVKLAYLPGLGKVRLRLTAKGTDKNLLENTVGELSKLLRTLLADIMYGEEEDGSLEAVIASLLIDRKMTLATAESCTGGKLAEQFTALPGASKYFKASVVSYATETKIDVLHVPQELIETYSVVSEEVARAMAQNMKDLVHADFTISTTGNAGPTKGDSDAPIGTVYIGIASPKGVSAQKFSMGNQRERIIQKTANKALELLQKEILKF